MSKSPHTPLKQEVVDNLENIYKTFDKMLDLVVDKQQVKLIREYVQVIVDIEKLLYKTKINELE